MRLLKRFLSYYRPHRGLFILDMAVAMASAVLGVLIPSLSRHLLKTDVPTGNMNMIITTCAIMVGVIIFKTVFTYIRIRWGHIMGVRMEYDMRADIFYHLQKLSFTYYDNTKTGHIMSRISNDLNTIAEVAHHAPEDLIISIIMIIGAFFVMFFYSVPLSIIAMLPIPFMLVWGLTYGRRMKAGFRAVRRSIAEINSNVENSVQGIREVKSYANEELEIDKFRHVNNLFRKAKERMYAIMAVFHSGMSFMSDLYYVVVVAGGAVLITQGKVSVIDLLAFTMYIGFILTPIQRLVNFVEQFQQGAASFERFVEVMDLEPDIKDRKGAKPLKVTGGHIRLDHLDFAYAAPSDQVLFDLDIDIPGGKTVALVGESGAGKSTLASLIPRFYEPTSGKITIDGQDVGDVTQQSLRESIGLVQQNPFLFDTTIAENILYGNPQASEEEMIEAARKAYILDFINSLPDGFDTLVGERGVKLSGGQKQRISIARVFLKNPPILVFDEATSSLDTQSEAYIQAALEELSQGRTTIIIAHRLSTVRNADTLFVLKQGKLLEQGTHDELIAQEGYYWQLYNRNVML